MEPQTLGPEHVIEEPQQSQLLGHSRDLWRDAPGWRLLVGSTAALFMASVATALVAQRHETPTPAQIAAVSPEAAPAPPAATAPVPTPSPWAPAAPTPAPAAKEPVAIVPPPAIPLVPHTARLVPPEAQSAPSPEGPVCNYRGGSGGGGQGRVVGFLSRDQAAKLLTLTQQKTHAKINPEYVSNARVLITVPSGRRVVVLLPRGLTVKPGDRVAFNAGHRDWSMACGYVPNLIIGLLQPE